MRGLRRRLVALACTATAGAMILTGCLNNPNQGGGGAPGGGGEGIADNAEADGDGVVTILGAFGGQEQEGFLASLEEFEAESGITIQYTADQDFTNTIRLRTNSGQAPDIAIFPQPGGLLELAEEGYIQPIDTYLDFDALDRTLVPGFLESARMNGRAYGAPMRMAVKSIVWYPAEAYEAGGYNTEPADLDELDAVAEEIKADGITPWCMGWGSDRRPAGSAPTGSRSTCSGSGGRTCTTSGPRTRSRSTTSASSPPSTPTASCCRPRATCSAARPGCSRHRSATRCSRRSTTRRSACWSGRATSSRASCPTTCRPTSTTRSGCSCSRGPRTPSTTASRSWAAVTSRH